MLELLPIAKFAETAAEEKTGIAVLGIDPKVILLQAGTFFLLYMIIRKFALKKIVTTLEQRRQTIDKGVELGIEMQKQKELFDEKFKEMQHEARAHADQIIAEANKEAGEILKAGELSATDKIETMMQDASARIEREMEKARKDLRSEMLSLVADATETIIGEKLDEKKDASLIERALAKVRA